VSYLRFLIESKFVGQVVICTQRADRITRVSVLCPLGSVQRYSQREPGLWSCVSLKDGTVSPRVKFASRNTGSSSTGKLLHIDYLALLWHLHLDKQR
jgi:hypothetical protein